MQDRGHNPSLHCTLPLCKDGQNTTLTEEFQVWKLLVRADRSATIFCDDGNGNIVFTQEIPFTDFPIDEVKLYFANNIIHLPSEY